MKLQDKLANSVRQIKTQQAEKPQKQNTTTRKRAKPVKTETAPIFLSQRTWPD
ncbi:hypothetical protein MNBD_GAMMA18-852 [hydrothermal vent metagenome]|uniref:Uncharacterized protein n=1 Tax=hydrothermal vent metagenome TaxID=652676 RepID=A0A3B0Z9Q1_9ZZZZ